MPERGRPPPTTTRWSSTSSSTSSCPRRPSAPTSCCRPPVGGGRRRRTHAEGRIVLRHKAADPPGEAREDWWIVCEIARRLGHGERFAFGSIGDIFEELRGASAGGIADYSGVTYERLEHDGGCSGRPPRCPRGPSRHPAAVRGRPFQLPGRAGAVQPRSSGRSRPSRSTRSTRVRSPPAGPWRTSCRATRRGGSARSSSRRPAPLGGGPPVARLRERGPGARGDAPGEHHVPGAGDGHDPRRHRVHPVPLGEAGGREPAHGRRAAPDLEDPRVQGVRVPDRARDDDRRDPAAQAPGSDVPAFEAVEQIRARRRRRRGGGPARRDAAHALHRPGPLHRLPGVRGRRARSATRTAASR